MLILIFGTLVNVLFSQEPNFINFNQEQGVPSSEVYHSIQDSRGYMWFATDRGVCRYDGYRFKTFNARNGMIDEVIFELFEDYKGRIWFVGLSGRLSYFFNDSIHEYKYNDALNKAYKYKQFYSFAVDTNDQVYLGSFRNGLIEVNAEGGVKCSGSPVKSCSLFSIQEIGPFMISSGVHYWSTSVFQSSIVNAKLHGHEFSWEQSVEYALKFKCCPVDANRIAVLCGNNVWIVNPVEERAKQVLQSAKVYTGMYFDGNLLWLYEKNNGVKAYEFNGNSLQEKFHFFKNLSISCVRKDIDGGFWFTSLEKGIYYSPSLKVQSFNLKDGLASDYVGNLSRFGKHPAIGFNTNIGYQILYNDSLSEVFNSFDSSYVRGKAAIPEWSGCLLSFTDAFVYDSCSKFTYPTGTAAGLIIKWYEKGLLLAKNGRATSISNSGKLQFKLRTEQAIDACYMDRKGALWVGNLSGLYKRKGDSLFHYAKVDSLFTKRVVEIDANDHHDLIVATRGNGLILIKGDSVKSVHKIAGIDFSNITCMYIDDGQSLWIGTSSGLVKLNPAGDSIHLHFTIWHGLPSNEITSVLLNEDRLLVGTKNGLAVVESIDDITSNPHRVKPLIQQISVDNIPVDMHYPLNVYHNNKWLSVQFTDLNYRSLGHSSYRYRLKGIIDNWIHTDQNEINITSLPEEGNYSLEIQAADGGGGWSQPAQVNFIAYPPFYKTQWFKVTSGTIIIILIFLFFKFNLLSYNKHVQQELIKRLMQRMGKKKYVIIRSDREEIRIAEDDINYIQSSREYVLIITNAQKHLYRTTMKDMLGLLGDSDFIRIHRSYIVRKDKIDSISTDHVRIKNELLPIGKTYRQSIKELKVQFREINQ